MTTPCGRCCEHRRQHAADRGYPLQERSAAEWTKAVPLAHLSIEVGHHLYMEDFAGGPARLRDHFAAVAPWVEMVRITVARPGARTRVSTCFPIDDYFTRFSSPSGVVPELLRAADAGVAIDYLARESACAHVGDSAPASLLAARLVPPPPEGSNGSRPRTEDAGWMSNSVRSSTDTEIGARRHSVFLDVQLWDDEDGRRTWSCAHLAAVWQLLRLGLLRDRGAAVAVPVP